MSATLSSEYTGGPLASETVIEWRVIPMESCCVVGRRAIALMIMLEQYWIARMVPDLSGEPDCGTHSDKQAIKI